VRVASCRPESRYRGHTIEFFEGSGFAWGVGPSITVDEVFALESGGFLIWERPELREWFLEYWNWHLAHSVLPSAPTPVTGGSTLEPGPGQDASAKAEAEAAAKAEELKAQIRRRQEEARRKFEDKKRSAEPVSTGKAEFAVEAKRVVDTVELAGVARRDLADWGDSGADWWASVNLVFDARKRDAELWEVQQECHFARMDVRTDDDGVRTHYIGYQGFHYRGLDVVDWRAPVAQLYYQGDGPRVSYDCPNGKVNAFLLLKRDLVVSGTALEKMTDLVDRRQTRG